VSAYYAEELQYLPELARCHRTPERLTTGLRDLLMLSCPSTRVIRRTELSNCLLGGRNDGRGQKDKERDVLASRRRIFTVDVELDEIMTAFKLTFMNLCKVLMKDYLGVRMELDTLVESILTLPGERVCTKTTEVIRIYRQPRDNRAIEAVTRACKKLTQLEMTRGDRRLSFEVCDPPRTAKAGRSK